MSCSLGERDAASACPADLYRGFSCNLPYFGCIWESHRGVGKNNNPSAPAQKGNGKLIGLLLEKRKRLSYI